MSHLPVNEAETVRRFPVKDVSSPGSLVCRFPAECVSFPGSRGSRNTGYQSIHHDCSSAIIQQHQVRNDSSPEPRGSFSITIARQTRLRKQFFATWPRGRSADLQACWLRSKLTLCVRECAACRLVGQSHRLIATTLADLPASLSAVRPTSQKKSLPK